MDSRVQNPMKLTVQEILEDQRLMDSLNEFVSQTLEKLNDMSSEIANSLNPIIPNPEVLKWTNVL